MGLRIGQIDFPALLLDNRLGTYEHPGALERNTGTPTTAVLSTLVALCTRVSIVQRQKSGKRTYCKNILTFDVGHALATYGVRTCVSGKVRMAGPCTNTPHRSPRAIMLN